MIQNRWRDLVSRLKQQKQPADEEIVPEEFFQIYICRSCSGDLLYAGVGLQVDCPHCGRPTLELQREMMEKISRQTRSVLEVSEALALFQQRDLAAAIKKLQSAIELDPGNNDAHYNLGEIYFQDGRVADGIAATRRAIELDDSDAMAHVNLGTGLIEQGKTDEALVEYDRAIVLDPNNALARFNRGLTLLKAMRIDEAREEWQRFLKLEQHSERADTVRGFFQRFGG